MGSKGINVEKELLRILKKRKSLSVNDLVNELSSLGIHRRDIAIAILKLWKNGKVSVKDMTINNFFNYLVSVEGIWFWIMATLVTITLLIVFFTIPQIIFVRYVLGSLYVLYLPGYALIEALYPRGDELSPLERLALSIGLSLALVPLVGLLLNYTPWGIRLEPVTISLAILTLSLTSVAIYRKYVYFKLET